MRFRLLRHATLLVEVAGKKILVDPMLSPKEEMDPVKNAANTFRIPMVDMPLNTDSLTALVNDTHAVLVTHTHRDHWDIAAQQLIAKDKLIICQPADEAVIRAQGFTNLQVIAQQLGWDGIRFYRTNGQHGTGETGKLMGTVSGFVIQYKNEWLYIAGDTIWCTDVQEAIDIYQPGYIIVNGGGAQFLEGGPITMTTKDVIELARYTIARISVVHLDTVNHCIQRRTDFQQAIREAQLEARVNIPNDGEWIII